MKHSEIIAHRGASVDAPENTLASIREAWTQGANNVECDVRLSRDGVVILLHDDNLLRTTGINQSSLKCTYAEIAALDAGSWKGPRWCGEKVPTLHDALEATPPGKRWTIEIKGGLALVPYLCEELKRACACGWVSWKQIDVISFDFAALLAIRMKLPDVRIMYLVSHWKAAPNPLLDDIITLCRAAGLHGVSLHYPHLTGPEVVEKIHAAGLLCATWTVNEIDLVLRFRHWGVDLITTDLPGVMLRAVRELQGSETA